MISRYRVSIGGKQLDEYLQGDERFVNRLHILNIGYAEPGISRTIETPGDSDGGVITRTYRAKAAITITFGLYVYNTADRYEACELIKSLCAKGGTVTTSDRPGKSLFNCVCEQYPEIDSSRDWTAPLTMVLTAYAFPYWVNTADTVKSLTGTKTSASLNVPGNAPSANIVAEVTIGANFSKPKDNAATLSLTVGSTNLQFSYKFDKNNYILIDTDSKNNLRARLYDNATNKRQITSLLPYMLPKSTDKLLGTPGGNNTIAIEAAKTITAAFKTKGAWL